MMLVRAPGDVACNGDAIEKAHRKLPIFKLAASSESDTEAPDSGDKLGYYDPGGYDDDDSDIDYGHCENEAGIENRQQNKEFLKRLGINDFVIRKTNIGHFYAGI